MSKVRHSARLMNGDHSTASRTVVVSVFQVLDAEGATTAAREGAETDAADYASNPGGRAVLLGDVGNTILATRCAIDVNRHI